MIKLIKRFLRLEWSETEVETTDLPNLAELLVEMGER